MWKIPIKMDGKIIIFLKYVLFTQFSVYFSESPPPTYNARWRGSSIDEIYEGSDKWDHDVCKNNFKIYQLFVQIKITFRTLNQ